MRFWVRPPSVSGVGLLIGCVLMSLLASCRPTFDQLNHTRKRPEKSDLVGTWVLDPPTLELLRKRGGYDTSIQTSLVLKTDGTFNLLSMPDWWSDGFGQSHGGFEEHAGTWTTSKYGENGIWQLELRASSGTRFANLIGQSAPYRLEFVIGDADNNVSMTFTKQLNGAGDG